MKRERHGPAGIVVAVVVTVLAFGVVSGAVARSRSSSADSATFGISAESSSWFDTGLVVPRGSVVEVDASSNATCHAPTGPNCEVGVSSGLPCSQFGLAPGPAGNAVPFGEWAVRVGAHGTPRAIGKGYISVGGPGRVYLVYNDCAPPSGYSDNDGGAFITLAGNLGRKPRPPKKPIPPPAKPKKGTVVARVTELNGVGYVTRGGKTTTLGLHDDIKLGDVIGTASRSSLRFDFGLGGAGGIAPGTTVTVGERSVTADGKTTLDAQLKVAGSVGKLKEPLEIAPAGQNTGVKG